MAVLQDSRGNEFSGALDHIGGQTVTDGRAFNAVLLSLGAESVIDLNGHASLRATIIAGAATVPTFVFEGTVDGTNYFTLPCPFTTGVVQPTASTITTYSFPCAGFRRVRCRVTTAGTNGATVAMRASRAAVEPACISIATQGTAAIATLTFTTPGAGNFVWLKGLRLVVTASAAQAAAAAITAVNWTGVAPANVPILAANASIDLIDRMYPGRGVRCTAANAATSFASAALAAGNTATWSAEYYVAGAFA